MPEEDVPRPPSSRAPAQAHLMGSPRARALRVGDLLEALLFPAHQDLLAMHGRARCRRGSSIGDRHAGAVLATERVRFTALRAGSKSSPAKRDDLLEAFDEPRFEHEGARRRQENAPYRPRACEDHPSPAASVDVVFSDGDPSPKRIVSCLACRYRSRITLGDQRADPVASPSDLCRALGQRAPPPRLVDGHRLLTADDALPPASRARHLVQ